MGTARHPDPRQESEAQRDDRNLGELLQELRVAGLGVQILFGFLLSLPFTAWFTRLSPGQRDLYLASLVLAAVGTALLVGPVAYHRLVFRRGQKEQFVRAASVMAIGGLAAVALAVSAAVLLVTSYVGGGLAAGLIAAFVATKFGLLWFAFPLARRHLPRRTVREATRLRGRVPVGQQTGGERLLADGSVIVAGQVPRAGADGVGDCLVEYRPEERHRRAVVGGVALGQALPGDELGDRRAPLLFCVVVRAVGERQETQAVRISRSGRPKESVVPPVNQQTDPAETPVSTTPACQHSSSTGARPCACHTASRFARLPPATQIMSWPSRSPRTSAVLGWGYSARWLTRKPTRPKAAYIAVR